VPINTGFNVNLSSRQQTDTSVKFDFNLRNEGNATASKVELRVVVFAKDVTLQTSGTLRRPAEPLDSSSHTFLIQFDLLRPRVEVPMTITFNFPKGQQPFEVLFNVDADEIETGTFLGSIKVRPRKPLDD
jgi:hypothetical protein